VTDNAGVAQWPERGPFKPRVAGPTPAAGTTMLLTLPCTVNESAGASCLRRRSIDNDEQLERRSGCFTRSRQTVRARPRRLFAGCSKVSPCRARGPDVPSDFMVAESNRCGDLTVNQAASRFDSGRSPQTQRRLGGGPISYVGPWWFDSTRCDFRAGTSRGWLLGLISPGTSFHWWVQAPPPATISGPRPNGEARAWHAR
jgi:hypothetical protein